MRKSYIYNLFLKEKPEQFSSLTMYLLLVFDSQQVDHRMSSLA
ncbi:hypothetical protein [Endozoicomonas sp. SCSIO W0465]|nr:hypothetical protein [Endozoicomonas sp. SCSIO W0465]